MSVWQRKDLSTVPHADKGLRPGDPGYDAYLGDAVLDGHPDLVLRPRSEPEIVDLLAYAHDRRIPVTPAGGLSGLSGAAAAEEGILLATEGMSQLLDLRPDDPQGPCAVVEPGMWLGDLKRELEAAGWFYPPDPTSRDEARVGGTVATNATGADTLLYGPTRKWVRGLRVVLADGTVRDLRRPTAQRPQEEKATAGYYPGDDEIDLVIGSEGTLGVITQLTLDLTRPPQRLFAGIAFFSDLRHALDFTVAARASTRIRPRALELFDRRALDRVGSNPEGVVWPEETGAAIYFKQEALDDAERDRLLEAWFDLVAEHVPDSPAGSRLLESLFVAQDDSAMERLRAFRHRVPATVHEVVRPYREHGGGKVGTDWWIPVHLIPDHLDSWRRRVEASGLDYVLFGHIGNGHPHVNLLPRDTGEMTRARALVHEMCRDAVRLGGGVAGEHGLGKLKRDLLPVQYPEGLDRMRAIKREWDPHWILGRGNLFPPEAS